LKHNRSFITDNDRRRIGHLLVNKSARAWGESRWLGKLEALLEQAKPIASQHAPDSLVTMNSTVLLADLETGERRTVTLVYPDDIDLVRGGLSVFEPLGTALLGCKVGEMVQCPSEEHGPMRVLKILYQPEQVGALHQ
jgi:regulator of nucleoside diphosphate kinase